MCWNGYPGFSKGHKGHSLFWFVVLLWDFVVSHYLRFAGDFIAFSSIIRMSMCSKGLPYHLNEDLLLMEGTTWHSMPSPIEYDGFVDV